jgi:hypothetical protein
MLILGDVAQGGVSALILREEASLGWNFDNNFGEEAALGWNFCTNIEEGDYTRMEFLWKY